MGTVRKRGDRYQGIVRITGHEPQYETFNTRKEAKDWIRDTEKAIESKVLTSPDIQISDLIDSYVKNIAPKRKMADSHLDHDIPSIQRVFKGMTMRDLIGRGLTDWVLKQDTHASTRHWHIARLFGVLKQVEVHDNVKMPWADMKQCRDKMWELGYLCLPNERDRRVSDDELTAIKANISKQSRIPAADLFDFCVASAMRIGEVCRITWEDFDESSRTVLVRDRKHPRRKFGNHQVVPLLNGSFEVLLRQPRKSDRIWPYHPGVVSKVFHRAAEKAGVKDVVLHDLRHEGVSRLFEMGFEIHEVALVSGHRDWKVLRRYTHLRPHSLVEKERRLLTLKAA